VRENRQNPNQAGDPRSSYRFWAAAFLIAAAALYVRLAQPPRIVDDAFITFRYAANLAAGKGFVYNEGQRVLATTTPLYTILLSIGAMLFGPDALPRWSTMLNAFSDAASAFLLCLIARRVKAGPVAALGVALLFAVNDESIIFSIGGMETSFYTLLLLASAAFVLGQRPVAGMFTLALAVVTRPDGVLAAGLLAAAWVMHSRRLDRRLGISATALLLPVLAWCAFAWMYFGSPIPQSVPAKQLAYSSDVRWWTLAYEFLQHGVSAVFGFLGLRAKAGVLAIVLHGCLFTTGAVALVRRRPVAWPLVVFPVLYGLAISAGSPFLFQWYVVPALPFWILGVVLGCEFWLIPISSRARRLFASNSRIWIEQVGIGLVLLAALLVQLGHFRPTAWNLRPKGVWTEREEIYQKIALDLRALIPENSRVALAEIGAFGFYHPARVLDALGLVSPEAQAYYPLPKNRYKWNSAIPSRLIQDETPEYVVAFRDFMRFTLLKSPSFKSAYRRVRTFPYSLWKSPGPWVYKRVSPRLRADQIQQAEAALEQGDFQQGFQLLEQPMRYSKAYRSRAIQLLDSRLCERLRRLSPWESRFSSGLFRDFEYFPDRQRWGLLDRWGRVFLADDEKLQPYGAVQMEDLDLDAVDLEHSRWGWIVLDSGGGVHPLRPEIALPQWMRLPPGREVLDAVDLEFTPDGQGLYVLDARGGVHLRGRTQHADNALENPLWDFDIARNLELSPDGKHLYILDGQGGIHHRGLEEGKINPVDPPFWGHNIIRDIEFLPQRNALLLAAANGSLHPYCGEPIQFPASLPYPGWKYLADIEFQPDTGELMALDGNGRLYTNGKPEEVSDAVQ